MRSDDILDNFDFDSERVPLHPEEGEIIARYFSLLEAEVAAARLRSEGISCTLINAYSASINPHFQIVVSLYVHPLTATKAREVLQEAVLDSLSIQKDKSRFWFWTIIGLIIGITLALLLVQYKEM